MPDRDTFLGMASPMTAEQRVAFFEDVLRSLRGGLILQDGQSTASPAAC